MAEPRSVVTTVDWDDRQPLRLRRMEFWTPSSVNQERVSLEVPTAWLAKQICPEHPAARYWTATGATRGFSHYRAHWTRLGRRWRYAVMFRCPMNHLWEVVVDQLLPERTEHDHRP